MGCRWSEPRVTGEVFNDRKADNPRTGKRDPASGAERIRAATKPPYRRERRSAQRDAEKAKAILTAVPPNRIYDSWLLDVASYVSTGSIQRRPVKTPSPSPSGSLPAPRSPPPLPPSPSTPPFRTPSPPRGPSPPQTHTTPPTPRAGR